MKKNSMIFLIFALLFFMTKPVYAQTPQPDIHGQFGVAIDAKTGEVIYDKNADEKAYPASMTKVLTSIVLDENIKDNQMLTVSANAAGQECSCFGLKEGEQISKKNALFGMLLLSANDLAVTIAENVGGSVPGFADLMNKEVAKLGLKNSHFVTPNGLHDPNHYTTPHDMALIMKEALKHPEVLKALSTQSIKVHTSLQDKEVRNPSRVHFQPNVIAGKTGFTNAAQNTLVEYLKKDGKEVIAVVMKTNHSSEYSDIQTMANYAFEQMGVHKVVHKGEVISTVKVNGKKVDLLAGDNYEISYIIGKKSNVQKEVTNTLEGKNQVKKGQKVGILNLKVDGKEVKEIPLIANKTVVYEKPATDFSKLIYSVIIVLVIYAIYVIQYNTKMKKREKKLKNNHVI